MSANLLLSNIHKLISGPVIKNVPNVIGISGLAKFNFNNIHRRFHTAEPSLQKSEVNVTFIRANGERIPAKGKIGDSLLDVVVDSDIDLEGYGACEGTLTCSTCHVILKQKDYNSLPESPGDEELDMLDLAHGLTETSRLGCQITLSKDLDGLEVQVPATINDARK